VAHYPTMNERPVLVTGIRVLDLICPIRLGGSLAITGDPGSGVVALAMETMRNLCRRYEAEAICRVTATEPFSESKVHGWVDKLRVGAFIREIVPADQAQISIVNSNGVVATLLPYAQSDEASDALVVLRRSLFEAGRLPAVDLEASASKLAADDPHKLAQRAKAEVAHGNAPLTEYLSQPFFVAEPWTSRPGEITEREETLEHVQGLIAAR
jgi:F0F1-type ATP synthase beta subunit